MKRTSPTGIAAWGHRFMRFCRSTTPLAHLIVVLAIFLASSPFGGQADDGPAVENGTPAPLGQFLTLPRQIDDAAFARVRQIALQLQEQAREAKRPGVLVLEIATGSSQFHHVQGLAKFLANELPSLTTVAWVPENLVGNHVVLALACKEIIMKPEAEMGNIGLGKALDRDEQSFVINLARRRHNTKLSEALVLGMMDPQKEIIWVQIQTGELPNRTTESRVVLPAEFDRLLRSKTVILKHETIKAPGTEGILSGEKARVYNILVMHTANSRDDVASLYRLPLEAMREDPTAGAPPRVMLIRIEEPITAMLEQFVHRQIQRAVAGGANLLIFEIDSPGGSLLSTMNLANAIVDLNDQEVRTVAYIPKQALSGAGIIALACDDIYLHPQALIGDAAPIELKAGGQFERAPEKILSVLKGYLRGLAEKKNRPVALAEAMADKSMQIYQVTQRDSGNVWYMTEDEIHNSNGQWIKGRLIPESGKDMLLTIDGERAHELHLANSPVQSLDELKQALRIPADMAVPVAGRTWVDTLVFVLSSTAVTTLLFILGIMFIYLELHFPTGLFGICSGLCFGLFFWSRFLGGTADWLEVLLFLMGALCIGLEIFVVPGFGVFGVSGVLMILFSLILASQTFIIPASTADFEELARSVGTLSGAIVGVIVLAALISRLLPSIPLFNAMILAPPGADESTPDHPRLRPDQTGELTAHPLLGQQGSAVTMLRPAGKAQIGEELVDVVSEGPFIAAGRPVEIVSVQGNRVVVRELS